MQGSAAATSTIAPARATAHRVLRRVFEQGAYADKALLAETAGLGDRDRALATRLAYGAVQRAGTSDHLIEALAGRPPSRLDGPVVASLRLGLYELLYLQGAPDYAVVADAVELAKSGGRGGHGLVNAVLRRATREGAGRLLGELEDATPAQAAVKHSHPQWIAELWWEELGPDQARELMARDNEPSELTLRANTLLGGASELAARLPVRTRRDPLIEEALIVEEPFDAYGSPLWSEGAFTAQSRAAMLVSRALDPQPGDSVLDLCAAPGGKTTHLAALMEGRGRILAVEADARRARALERSARRMRADIVAVQVADARAPRAAESYDRVLVDPPCSGLGTLQARADLRWRASLAAIANMCEDQFRILDCGAQALRPGGVLVYSTCTISPTENEHLIADFLDRHPDFQLDDLATEMPDFAMSAPAREDQRAQAVSRRALLTLPHRHHTAGFFIARLRRN
ncbi:MAG: rRNA (cytosine967-C5)-methyltransferase [Solirubrobacteraceae bacterium]|nr:sun protein [Solirubrobacterales bacterium]MEA2216715.1 rRNA (cytosine967-C5)-methyltransferase [Solirubrobacteraceae bacterium]